MIGGVFAGCRTEEEFKARGDWYEALCRYSPRTHLADAAADGSRQATISVDGEVVAHGTLKTGLSEDEAQDFWRRLMTEAQAASPKLMTL